MTFLRTKIGIAVIFLIGLAVLVVLQSTVFGGTFINLTLDVNPNLDNGLVGHWTFDGDLSSTIPDSSGNGNTGYFITGGEATSTKVTTGVLGQGVHLDAIDDDITMGDASSVEAGTGNFTVAAWIRVFDNDVGYITVDVQTSGAAHGWFMGVDAGIDSNCRIGTTGSGKLNVREEDADLGYSDSTCGIATVNDGIWHHVAYSRNGTTRTTYVDGKVDISGTYANIGNLSNNGPFTISDLTDPLDAIFDDVRVYNRALSAEEVKRLYDLGATTHINQTLDTNPDLQNGLLSHWTFDGPDIDWGSGNPILDRGSSGNDLTVTGLTSTNVVRGKLGQAINFAGNNTYASLSSISTYADINKTVAAWIYPYSTGESGFGMVLRTSNGGGFGWQLNMCDNNPSECPSTSNTVELYQYFSGNDGIWYVTGSNSIQMNEWNHVVVVYDNSSVSNDPTFYINGVQVASAEAGTPTGSRDDGTTIIHIGDDGIGNYEFDGLIDDARIYNRSLSAEEVKRLYELGGTTHINTTIDTNPDLQNGLVGHWTFDGKDITDLVIDSSGQGNNGLLKVGASGNNTSTTTVPGRIGQAVDLDGTDDWVDVDTPAELDSSTAKTFAVWVYPRTLGGSNFGTIYAANDLGDKMYFSLCDSDGTECPSRPSTFIFNDRDSGGIQANEWTAPANIIQLNKWQHLVVTYNCDGSSAKFYYNGKQVTATQVATHSAGCADSSTRTKYIGYASNSGFDGHMDDFRVYNRVLSADEVERLYELGR